MKTNDVSVVIPAFREEDNLKKLIPAICSVMDRSDNNYEIIIVDTLPSLDNTEQLCKGFSNVRYISRSGGNHYGDAIRSGIAAVRYPLTVIMDADCSHSPEELPVMLKKAEQFDLVIASRYIHGGSNANSRLSIFFSCIVNSVYRFFMQSQIRDLSNSFRVYRSHQLKSITLECNNFDIVEEIISKLLTAFPGINITETPCSFRKRAFGTSKRSWISFILSYIFSIFKIANPKTGIEKYLTALCKDRKRFRTFICNAAALIFFVQLFCHAFVNVFARQRLGSVSYTLAFHFFDYSSGFVTRGLYGSTLGKLTSILPLSLYFLFWFVLMAAPYFFLYRIYWTKTKDAPGFNDIDIFMLFAICLPTSLLPAIDIFRLDIINYAIFIATAYFCWQGHKLKFIAPISAVLMILLHDASLFMFVPALGAIILFHIKNKCSDWLLFCSYCASTLLSVWLYWIARNAIVDPEAVNMAINQKSSYGIHLDLAGHFFSINSGYVAYMLENQFSWHWLWMAILSIPFVFLAWMILKLYWREARRLIPVNNRFEKCRSALLFYAPFSFLILFIGCDYNRWYWAFLSVNIFLLLMFMTEKNARFLFLTISERFFIVSISLMFFIMGAGNIFCFSEAIISLARFFALLCHNAFGAL